MPDATGPLATIPCSNPLARNSSRMRQTHTGYGRYIVYQLVIYHVAQAKSPSFSLGSFSPDSVEPPCLCREMYAVFYA